jgi:hypothetical protein
VYELLEWIEHHPGLAAWFQAVGAIVAVGVAIWVPAYQHKVARDDAEKDRRLKARSLALRMLPTLLDLDSHVKQAIQKTQTISLAMPGPVIIQLVGDATVGIPQELVDDADQLYLLGEKAGFPTQQLLAFLGQHTRVLERAQLTAVTTVDQSVIPEVHRTIADSLAQVGKLLDVSIERVRAIHNGEW